VKQWDNMTNYFQKAAMDTRLAIPLLYGIDAVHGNNNIYGATIFPHNIGLGCTGYAFCTFVTLCNNLAFLWVMVL
jgi:beta-glucosidase